MIRAIARIWAAAFAQGNLRLWAIILGAPPFTLIVAWVIRILEKLATAENVDPAIARYIAFTGYGVLAIVAIIVVALATVKVRATIPGASLDIAGED